VLSLEVSRTGVVATVSSFLTTPARSTLRTIRRGALGTALGSRKPMFGARFLDRRAAAAYTRVPRTLGDNFP
jgi:hypothetical protein